MYNIFPFSCKNDSSNKLKNVLMNLGASGFLGGLMGYRSIMSGKFMPAGLVATLRLVVIILQVL